MQVHDIYDATTYQLLSIDGDVQLGYAGKKDLSDTGRGFPATT